MEFIMTKQQWSVWVSSVDDGKASRGVVGQKEMRDALLFWGPCEAHQLLKLTAFCWNEPKQPLSWWEGHLTPVSSDCSNSIEVNLPQEFQFWVDCDFKIKAEHIKFPPSLGFCPIKASCFIKSTLYVLWHKHTHCTVTVPNAAAWS